MSTLDKIRTLAQVAEERERWRAEGRRVALANGIFDLLHVGHVRYLPGVQGSGAALHLRVRAGGADRRAGMHGSGYPLR
jgi:D-glycero-beta-D-manno-heptose 1-phosphate adenylyltransferase